MSNKAFAQHSSGQLFLPFFSSLLAIKTPENRATLHQLKNTHTCDWNKILILFSVTFCSGIILASSSSAKPFFVAQARIRSIFRVLHFKTLPFFHLIKSFFPVYSLWSCYVGEWNNLTSFNFGSPMDLNISSSVSSSSRPCYFSLMSLSSVYLVNREQVLWDDAKKS